MPLLITVEEEIHQLISQRASQLLIAANYLPEHQLSNGSLTRPLLGMLMRQSIELEELLDTYGAKNNKRWSQFRSLVAAIKLFSTAGYEILHIIHALDGYKLLPIEQDFNEANDKSLTFTSCVLLKTCSQLLSESAKLNLPIPSQDFDDSIYAEIIPPGRLPSDIETRKVDSIYETITLLATEFLNLAQQSKHLQNIEMPCDDKCQCFDSSYVTEENLRHLSQQFHNLQSLYDTFVSETDAEDLDTDLIVLRGHITVVYHLLIIATYFGHYYERHVRLKSANQPKKKNHLLDPKQLLEELINYAIAFANSYTACARKLCKSMLKRYTEVDQIEVNVPVYRGFHVRPSTLVAEIVHHYGTDVQMILDDEECNAAVPMEIFRINEKINARKRRYLTAQIEQLGIIGKDITAGSVKDLVRKIILNLSESGDLVIYEQPLLFPEDFESQDDIVLKRITFHIARLQAEGKIDIKTDIKIKFKGDKRVLRHLKILAENGYGEDSFGNNIPLPEELTYLRQ